MRSQPTRAVGDLAGVVTRHSGCSLTSPSVVDSLAAAAASSAASGVDGSSYLALLLWVPVPV